MGGGDQVNQKEIELSNLLCSSVVPFILDFTGTIQMQFTTFYLFKVCMTKDFSHISSMLSSVK